MRPIPEAMFRPATAPRHARLFELIRQDHLFHCGARRHAPDPMAQEALDTFRAMACRSLMRQRH